MQFKIESENFRNTSPTFIALVLHLYGGKGHVFSYQKSVGAAVDLIGWDHLAAVSPDPVIKSFPAQWRPVYVDSGVLDYEGSEILKLLRNFSILPFISGMYIFARAMRGLIEREMTAKLNKKIIFLETFNPLQLMSLVFALIFMKHNRIAVWLLHRGGPNWGGSRHRLLAQSFAMSFRAIHPLIELVVGRNNLVLLTDSEKLRTSLQEYYKRPVQVVPIPHTPAALSEESIPLRHLNEEISCWWPGAPRPEKGLAVIRRIASEKNEQAFKIKLFVAESANLKKVSGGIKVKSVADNLGREEYDRMFFASNLILLPYDQEIYNESTSGIFTESIAAGAIPLVTKDTWMAYELEKYNLTELIIDWNDDNIISKIVQISSDVKVKQKVKDMQIKYMEYHNIKSFAQVLKSIYEASGN